jgi:hypothetical protein
VDKRKHKDPVCAHVRKELNPPVLSQVAGYLSR